jgi:hypothetical protein
VAVIVTLAYLAIQVSHNTKAVISATEVAGGEQVLIAHIPIAQDSQLADILHRGGIDFRALDPPDRIRFAMYWQGVLIAHQGYFFQHRRRFLRGDMWRTYARQIDDGVNQSGFKVWWKRGKRVFEDPFQTYIEAKWIDDHEGR